MAKKKVRLGSDEVDADPVQVTSSSEHFNDYLLEDGTTLKLKTVVIEVLRVSGVTDGQGNPVYVVKSQNVMHVEPPREH